MIKESRPKIRIALISGAVLVLIITGVLFGFTWPLLQVKAGPTLPPRKETPPSVSSDPAGDDDDTPIGAHIELHVQSARTGVWTVVQWQDSAGNWHDVEGWQGELEGGNTRRWWVAARDFGKGPFRWLVASGPEDEPLVTSTPFDLPHQANEIVQIEVLLEP